MVLASIVAILAAIRITGLLQHDDFGPIVDLRGFILSRWPGAKTKFLQSEVTGDDTYGYRLAKSGREAFKETETVTIEREQVTLDTFYVVDPHPIGKLWECPRCLGYWISLLVVLSWLIVPLSVWWAVMLPLAVSQLVIWGLRIDAT